MTSLHERIVSDVEKRVVSGEWPPGHRIPFEVELAQSYGCSRMTVNKALTQLARAGLLERNRKSGTFVKAPQTLSAALEISDIQKEVEDSGKIYGYQLLKDEVLKASEEQARLLELKKRAPIRRINCLHLASEKPFCLEERMINIAVTPEAQGANFEAMAPGAWMLQQVPWNAAEHQISAMAANEEVANQLDIDLGGACLVIERRTQNENGYVTWARFYYAGDSHRLFATFTPTGAN